MGARKFVLPRIRHLVPYHIPLGDITPTRALAAGRGLPDRPRGRAGADRAEAVDRALNR